MLIRKNIIEKGIQYIAENQRKDGSFISLSSPNGADFTNAISYRTNFITSIILETFSSLDDTPLVYRIKKKAAHFLLSQKSEQWSWNYWSKSSKEFTTLPYPNDLDDTFCALNALFLFDKKVIPGSAYAHILQLLTSVEKKEGGPYKTWLVSKNTLGWDDVDIVVNSNIAYFLWMQEVTLPNLQTLFEDKLQKKNLRSKYYPSIYPLLYFLSRFYSDKKSIEHILIEKRNKKGYWDNPLYTALAIIALFNGNFSPKQLEKSIAYLLEQQNNYHWQAYPFCIDPTIGGEKYYAGSEVLTTTFCLCAISLYMKRRDLIKLEKEENSKKIYIEEIRNSKVLQFGDKKINEIGGVLLNNIMSKDKTKQIPLMPYYFLQTLAQNGKQIQKKQTILLGQANVLGWLAYTIYDDFLDDEANPAFLPLANMYLARLIHIFETAFPKNNSVPPFFYEVLDSIESANFWEVTHCRLPVKKGIIHVDSLKLADFNNLEQLAHKSLGHGLGPLTILLLLGYKKTDKEFIALYRFFIHYLIAKQLHDDCHDWEEDLSKGHVTFVVALLLKKAKKKKIITRSVDIKKITLRLQKLFWYEIIEEVCEHIYNHVRKAQKELESSSIIIKKDVLEDLLIMYKDGADKALAERKKTIDFLESY